MLKRLQRWSRTHLALVAMMVGVIVLGLAAPCVAAAMTPMQPMAAAPMQDRPCCEDHDMQATMTCPLGCRVLAPTVPLPAAPVEAARVSHWAGPAFQLHGIATAPDDPPPR